MHKKISWDDFVKTYKPQLNHLDSNASMGEGWMYETFGEEIKYVHSILESEPNRIWTVLDTDEDLTIASGYHYVNRMGYVICEVPFNEGEMIELEND
jgi:hypothetical protein